MAGFVIAVGVAVPPAVPAGTHFYLVISIPADVLAGIVSAEDTPSAFVPFHLEVLDHVLSNDPTPIILVYIPLSPFLLRPLS